MINEKGVVKNVSAARARGVRAGTTAAPALRGGIVARPLLAAVLTAVVFSAVFSSTASARSMPGLGEPVSLSSLPPEAQQTEQRILAGGPFPFARDGVVFGNYEKRLEREPRGYYHEYTVPTPGARNRGARRIICGGARPTEPAACFYTEDHYSSFHRIVK